MPADPTAIAAVSVLAEPARRALYEWVVAAGRPVGRDEAAAGTGVGRALAAFHLDRLVDAGLLTPAYRRLSGRSGPGAGRPAKVYERSDREVRVSLPERRYEVPARVLAEAIERLAGEPGEAPAAVASTARSLGRDVGAAARARAGPRTGRRRRRAALVATLAERGYEPRATDAGEIRLANCPFDALVEAHRDLVCGMNLALAEGIVDSLGAGLRPRLDPQPGWCCVALADEATSEGR